jgi:tetratricopeptide (TPR) repeat protein
VVLDAQGDTDGASHCYTKALDSQPRFPQVHNNLGMALHDKGDVDGAIAEYKKAIALDPGLARAQAALGQLLLQEGRFAEARAATRRSLELLPERDPSRQHVSSQLQDCERLAALDSKLPAILSGKEQTADAAERAEYAQLCWTKHLYAVAARLYREAITAQPARASSPDNHVRYNAACAAALAAAGQGQDAAKLDARERAHWRKQALAWLRANLELWRKALDQGKPAERAKALQALRHWQQDADLAGLRDDKALAGLPGEERDACRKFWADVAALMQKATPPP